MMVKEIAFEEKLDWDGLIRKSKTTTFFQTKEWLSLWWKHFGPSTSLRIDPSTSLRVKGQNSILGVYEDDSLVGIAPLEIVGDKITLLGTREVLGGELVSDYGDIIAKTSCEEFVWKEVLAKLRTKPACVGRNLELRTIRFDYIREDSPSFRILKELGGRVEEVDVAPYIDLPKTWEEYLGKLDRHNRHELRRKIRKVEEEGVVKVCIPFSNHFTDALTLKDAIQQPLGLLGNCKPKEERYAKGNRRNRGNEGDVDEFFRLMALSNDKKEGFLSSKMKAFFRDVIKTFWQKSMLELCFLKLGEINIAAAITFIYNNEILLYNSGFDPRYSSFSPGFVLKVFTIKEAIGKGKERYDFLRGGERYKYDLGGQKRNLYKISF